MLGAVEEISDDEARAVFDVNVFGTLTMQRAVLPVLRAQRSGHVINISSVGGLVGSPGWGIYGATKFAMEGFTEALSQELAPLGYVSPSSSPDTSVPTSSTRRACARRVW